MEIICPVCNHVVSFDSNHTNATLSEKIGERLAQYGYPHYMNPRKASKIREVRGVIKLFVENLPAGSSYMSDEVFMSALGQLDRILPPKG